MPKFSKVGSAFNLTDISTGASLHNISEFVSIETIHDGISSDPDLPAELEYRQSNQSEQELNPILGDKNANTTSSSDNEVHRAWIMVFDHLNETNRIGVDSYDTVSRAKYFGKDDTLFHRYAFVNQFHFFTRAI